MKDKHDNDTVGWVSQTTKEDEASIKHALAAEIAEAVTEGLEGLHPSYGALYNYSYMAASAALSRCGCI